MTVKLDKNTRPKNSRQSWGDLIWVATPQRRGRTTVLKPVRMVSKTCTTCRILLFSEKGKSWDKSLTLLMTHENSGARTHPAKTIDKRTTSRQKDSWLTIEMGKTAEVKIGNILPVRYIPEVYRVQCGNPPG